MSPTFTEELTVAINDLHTSIDRLAAMGGLFENNAETMKWDAKRALAAPSEEAAHAIFFAARDAYMAAGDRHYAALRTA
jgi:hypothetical protein